MDKLRRMKCSRTTERKLSWMTFRDTLINNQNGRFSFWLLIFYFRFDPLILLYLDLMSKLYKTVNLPPTKVKIENQSSSSFPSSSKTSSISLSSSLIFSLIFPPFNSFLIYTYSISLSYTSSNLLVSRTLSENFGRFSSKVAGGAITESIVILNVIKTLLKGVLHHRWNDVC